MEVGVDLHGVAQVEPGMVRVDRGDQLEVWVGEHSLADGRAHPAGCAEHPDPDRHGRAYARLTEPPPIGVAIR